MGLNMHWLKVLVLAAVVLIAGLQAGAGTESVSAEPDRLSVTADGRIIVNEASFVQVSIVSDQGMFLNTLGVAAPIDRNLLACGENVPGSASIGNVGPGELMLRLTTPSYDPAGQPKDFNRTYFTGPGSRNADGFRHAIVQKLSANVVRVSWEDLFGEGNDPDPSGHPDFKDCIIDVKASSGPPPLELLGFFGGGPASERECYELLAVVKNNGSSPITRTLTITESKTYRGFANQNVGSKPDSRRDCDGGGALSRTLTIPPGDSATFRFKIAHDWQWIPKFNFPQELAGAFLSAFNIPQAQWANLMLSVAKGTITVGESVNWVLNAATAAPRVDYTYSVDTTGMVVSGQTSQTVRASVSPFKVGLFEGAVTAFIEREIICRVAVFWPLAIPGCITATAMQWSLYVSAVDPVPDYMTLVSPVPLPDDALDVLPEGLPRDYAAQLLTEASLLIAARESAIRAAQADDANDPLWVATQLERARMFLQGSLLERAHSNSLLRGILANPPGDDPPADLIFYEPLWTAYMPDIGDIPNLVAQITEPLPGVGEDTDELFVGAEAGAYGYAVSLNMLIQSEIETRVDRLGLVVQPVNQATLDELATREGLIESALQVGFTTNASLAQINTLIDDVSALLQQTGDLASLSPFMQFGYWALARYATLPADNTPPQTAATLDGVAGERGWYISDVEVTLTSTDYGDFGIPGSGVAVTRYQINDGPWQVYAAPFVVDTESLDNVVRFYSEDIVGNIESVKDVHFKLDKTPPEIDISEGILDGLHWDQVHLERGILTNSDTLALSGEATDNLCLWEVRAVNDGSLSDSQSGNEDTALSYALDIPLHEGINNIDAIAEDCAGWEDDIRIQVVYVIPGPYDPRTKGFWYNAVKTSKYSDAEFQTLMDYTNVVSDVFGPDARNIYGLVTADNYRTILKSKSSDMEELQKAQLLGSWLNLVSGRVAVLTPADLSPVAGWPQVVDNTSGSPLTFAMNVPMEVEEIDQTGTATRAVYEIAKNLLDAFNNRMIIP